MNCEECIERVFELIEQEPSDGAGVEEVLERCPECRALFEEMKEALEQAAMLSLEEPSAATDEAIVLAARARIGMHAAPRRRWIRAPQFAAAAVVLLAVGVGMWTIPRKEAPQLEGALAEERMDEAKEEAIDGAKKQLPSGPTGPAALAYNDSGELGSPVAATSASEERRAVESSARKGRAPKTARQELGAAEVELDSAASGVRAGSAQAADVAMPAEAAPAKASKTQSDRRSRRCTEQLARIEEQDREAKAEESLALGRCFRDAGDVPKARHWFEAALMDRETRARARRELRALPPP